MANFIKLIKFNETFLTILWGNNALMGFPLLKSGETLLILEKTNHYKRVVFAQGLFFRSSYHRSRLPRTLRGTFLMRERERRVCIAYDDEKKEAQCKIGPQSYNHQSRPSQNREQYEKNHKNPWSVFCNKKLFKLCTKLFQQPIIYWIQKLQVRT